MEPACLTMERKISELLKLLGSYEDVEARELLLEIRELNNYYIQQNKAVVPALLRSKK